MTEQPTRLTIYTDGGADPNPGAGGFGVVILDEADGSVRELSGGEEETTNNRMELTAALRALESLDGRTRIVLFTDSKYLKQGITTWLPGWQAAGWKRKGGALKNVELWQALAREVARHDIDWRWVKGHAGNRWNERADELATAAIRSRQRETASEVPAVEADLEIFLSITCPRGRGAWGAVVRPQADPGAEDTLGAAVGKTTAPRLDLEAAAAVLAEISDGRSVAVYTGSDYLRNGASQWLPGWQRGGWKTKAGSPVKNRDLWQRLAAQLRRLDVVWPATKGKRLPALKEAEQAAKGYLAAG